METQTVKYDPNAVAQLREMLAQQEAAKSVAADEIRAKIVEADKALQSLRSELAALVPPVAVADKPRRRTSTTAAVNGAPNPNRTAIIAALATGEKATKELKAEIGDPLGSVTDYHLKCLEAAGLAHSPSHGRWAAGPAPVAA